MSNFWADLPKPIWALAPMEEVTDTVFRRIVAGVGKPAIYFSEFCNVDLICQGPWLKAEERLRFTSLERPIVAQIWGVKPENFFAAAKKIKELGFDGVDINLGCPAKDVVKMGACSGMIFRDKNKIQDSRSKVQEIIEATREGAGDLPVSVKTRIGYKTILTEEWIGFLLEQNLAAITVHGRTVAEESKVPAHWEEIGKAVILRNQSEHVAGSSSTPASGVRLRASASHALPDAGHSTLIIGNGDVKTLSESRQKVEEFGVDGVMIGRGIFANPALFSENELSQGEKIKLYRKHIQLFRQEWGEQKNWQILKKFMKVYVNGFSGASELREKIAVTKSILELEQIIEDNDKL